MKTFFIDLETLSQENNKTLLGYVLTQGLKFRKIDLVKNDISSKVLVVETETIAESKAFSEFLAKNEIPVPITILPNNKAVIGLKSIGKLKLLGENAKSNAYYLDKTTNKKLVIVWLN